jgi:hypothetical protein
MKRCAIYARPTRDLESTFVVAGMRWAWPEDLAGFALDDRPRSHHLRGRAEAMRVYAVVANPSCNGQEV